MYKESELSTALQNAHAAGDTQAAQHLAGVIQQQRTQWSQSNNFTDNSIVDKYGLDEAERMRMEDFGGNYSAADGMSKADRVTTGFGAGGDGIWDGIKQLSLRAAEAKGFPMGDAVQNLDSEVQQKNQQFNQDFDGDWYAKGGRIAGEVAATAPLGMGVGTLAKPLIGASRVKNALQYGKQGAAVGAAEASLMPTTSDNFLQEKALQVGLGAGLGGFLGGGVGAVKGTKELVDDGVGATIQNTVNKGSDNKIARAFIGDSAEKAEREALSSRTGVPLTPAEKSGSRLGQGLESLAEQSLLTADEVAEKAIIPGLNKLKDYALKQADSISKNVQSVDQVGRNIQQLSNTITKTLVKSRSDTGRKLYGEVDNLAKGQKVVQLDNVKNVFAEIAEETAGVAGSDLQKVANQAAKMAESFNDGMTAKQALNQLQSWTSKSSGKLFKDIEGFGVDDMYKKKLSDALLGDMDKVPGALGDKVRAANTAWRKGSEEISSLEASILGRVAGKNLASEVNGLMTNTIAPEKVIDTFRRARPSEVKAAIKYMDKFDPKMSKEFKANYIRMAIEEAGTNANSSGAQQILNPTQLLNSLGIKAGKQGVEGLEKLKAMFGDSPNGGQFVKDIVELSRIKADAFGRNFSGTAIQNEANKLLSSIGQFATGFLNLGKQVLGTGAHTLGIKSVARNMVDQAPFNKTIGPMTNTARNLSALGTPGVVNEVNNQERR